MADAVDSKRSVHRLCICTGDDLAGSSPACATFIREFGVAAVTLEFGSKGGGSIPSTSTKKWIGGISTSTEKRQSCRRFHFAK